MAISRTLLFDATCNLCIWWVCFLEKRDSGDLQFVSVQSQEGQYLLALHGYPTNRFDTLVYLEAETVYDKSAAIMKVLSALGSLWRLINVFLIVPAPLRDRLYLRLAANRYRIFGKVEDCHCGNNPCRVD